MDRNKNTSENYFSINVYERNSVSDIPVHWHDYYEIEICLDGEGVMTINNKEFLIKPNTLFFITPSDFHSYKINKELKLINITFPPHCIEYSQIQDLLLLTNCFVCPLKNETLEDIVYMIKQIHTESDQKNYMGKKYISHLMSCLLISLLRLEKNSKKFNSDNINEYPIPVQKAVYHLMANFKEKVTLESVADVVGISPGYLSKEFSKNVGVGFKDFLVDLRLEHACQLLIYSDETITNIAYYCGFNSTSYFLRAFRKKYNNSPLKYRKLSKIDAV